MLLSNLLTNPFGLLIFVVLILVTISVHEFAHAKVADELGDPTARLMGRLTLNPLAHIDPIGILLLLFIGFGWGRPVPFDPYNLKNPRRDAALISLAGPASNFIIAIICSIIIRVFTFFGLSFIGAIGQNILPTFIFLNIMLGVFNLLPFSPLDGFKIVGGFLSDSQAREWYGLERYGIFFLLFFIFPIVGSKSMLQILISPVINFVSSLLIPY